MNHVTATTNDDFDVHPKRKEVHQTITDQIVAAIEAGAGTFIMPWHRDIDSVLPTNFLTGKTYNGVNVIALWVAAEQQGFTSSYWASVPRSRLAVLRASERGNSGKRPMVFRARCLLVPSMTT